MSIDDERRRGSSLEEISESCLADLKGVHQAETRTRFIRRLREPGLEVPCVAEEIHQWAAGLSHTAPIL